MRILRSVDPGERTPDGMAMTLPWAFPAGTLTHAGQVVGGWFVRPEGRGTGVSVIVMCRGRGAVEVTFPDPFAMRQHLPDLLAGKVPDRGTIAEESALSGAPKYVGPKARFLSMGRAVLWMLAHLGMSVARDDDAAAKAMAQAIGDSMVTGPTGTGEDDVETLRDAARRVLAPFVATFDPEAIAFLTSHADDGGIVDGYDGLDATMVPGAPLRTAIGMVPDLTGTLAQAWRVDRDGFIADMARGDPFSPVKRIQARATSPWPRRLLSLLPEACAAHAGLDLPPAGTTRRHGRMASVDFDPLLDRMWPLRDMPAESLPRGVAGWAAYFRGSHVLVEVADTLCGAHDIPNLVGHVPDWESWGTAMEKAAGAPLESLALAVVGIEDVALGFERHVLAPAIRSAGLPFPYKPALVAANMIHGGRGLASILRTSRDWHARWPTIQRCMRELSGDGGTDPPWSAALPGFEEDGLALEVLTRQAELDDEGGVGPDGNGVGGLSHCVGGYAPRCRAGLVRIVSIRALEATGGYKRLSTAEIQPLKDGSYRVRQHAGFGNAKPSVEAVGFLDRYLDRITGIPKLVDRAGLKPMPEPRGRDGISASAGYDVSIPGNWEAVRDMWAPHLPSWMRTIESQALASMATIAPEGLGWPWIPRSFLRRAGGTTSS